MGCGVSVASNTSQPLQAPLPSSQQDSNASQPARPGLQALPPPQQENVLASILENLPLADLPDCVADLHYGMPEALKHAPMRLLKIANVLSWANLKVYEEVPPSACLSVPYSGVDDACWDTTAVLSWRWGVSKPTKMQHGYSPMLEQQFAELRVVLSRVKEMGLQYVWIDWCCVPQYSSNPMVEVLRSKVFYMRARAMIIIPTFHSLPPDGIVRLLLVNVSHMLRRRCEENLQCAITADSIDRIMKCGMVAAREYFSRVWTLAERMARHGRSERLCNWLSLEAWLGMVIDAMLTSTEDNTASQIYKKILGSEASQLLDNILEPLAAAVKTGSMLVSEGLDEMVGRLFELAVNIWTGKSILDEAPTKSWLLQYLEEAHTRTGVYQAWNEGDRVWAVYSYFCWKQLDQTKPKAMLEALQDLAQVAGLHRRHTVGLAKKLRVDKLLPVEKMDKQLFMAAEVGNAVLVQELIDQGANMHLTHVTQTALSRPFGGITPLHTASAKGHLDIIKALVAAGVDIDPPMDDGASPIYMAAKNGHLESVKYLLSIGADKNRAKKGGLAPIHAACWNGHLDVVKALVTAGADKDHLTVDGTNPIYEAADNGRLESVKYLLSIGADKNRAKEGGLTPIHAASKKGHVDVIKALVAAEVDIGPLTHDGETPIYLAAKNGHLEAVKYLLSVGADANRANKDGQWPIDAAKKYPAIVELLRARLPAHAVADGPA